MALFGKSEGFAAACKRVQGYGYQSASDLRELLLRIVEHEEASPAKMTWGLAHSDPKVRGFVGDWMLQRRDPSVLDLLLRELQGKSPQVREEIAGLLQRSGDAEGLSQRIGAMLRSQKKELREGGLALLAALPDWSNHLGLLKEALNDPVSGIRVEAAKLLARKVKVAAVFFLLRALVSDDDPAVRRVAIEALASHPTPDIVEPFFERLPQADSYEQTLMVQALGQLARDPRIRLEERLMPLLGDESANVREAALRLLAQMPNRTRILRSFLVHCRGIATWLRERTIQSMMKFSSDIVESLGDLMEDPEEDIRVGAMLMAASCKDDRVVPHALAVFNGDHDWWVRSMAAEVLAGFPQPEVVNSLLAQIESPELRYTVVSVLGRWKQPGISTYLLECLTDPQRCIRMAALDGLEGALEADALQIVFLCARGDAELAVREKAALVLKAAGAAGQPFLEELERVRKAERKIEVDQSRVELEMLNPSLRG
ncbi:MAG: HEAT repeat domain-containing protein [Planctomycetes bacterium]|nr:HEAT repeat domain-containing protein [Planctomycetota bacterium]